MSSQEDMIVGPLPEIPDKLYFRIGDVARLANIKPYVLRFWETEFPGLGPKKSGTGHRLYRRKDVEMVLEIKRLLYKNASRLRAHASSSNREPSPSWSRLAAARGKRKRVQGDLFVADRTADLTKLIDKVREELRAIAELLK